MADWPDGEENPFRVTPGQGSDVTTTSATGSSRRPALLCIPSVWQTCCHGLLRRLYRRGDSAEVSAAENNEGSWAGMTERIITVSALPQR